eukprot:5955456-Pleurochrysis_carterae.AAC.2
MCASSRLRRSRRRPLLCMSTSSVCRARACAPRARAAAASGAEQQVRADARRRCARQQSAALAAVRVHSILLSLIVFARLGCAQQQPPARNGTCAQARAADARGSNRQRPPLCPPTLSTARAHARLGRAQQQPPAHDCKCARAARAADAFGRDRRRSPLWTAILGCLSACACAPRARTAAASGAQRHVCADSRLRAAATGDARRCACL